MKTLFSDWIVYHKNWFNCCKI